VLLVEDDEIVRKALEALFSKWHILVESAADVDALSRLLDELERFPDLVVTDYRLPHDKTASDVVRLVSRALGDENNCPRIPVLLLTGESKADEIYRAIGADRYLTKPVQPADLRESMVDLIWQSRRNASSSNEE
jgi:CheY-like chemotaxis protein